MKIPRNIYGKGASLNVSQKVRRGQQVSRLAEPILVTYSFPIKNSWYEKQRAISAYMKNKDYGEFSTSYEYERSFHDSERFLSSYDISSDSLDRYFKKGKYILRNMDDLINSLRDGTPNLQKTSQNNTYYRLYTKISNRSEWDSVIFRQITDNKRYINQMLNHFRIIITKKTKTKYAKLMLPSQGNFIRSKLLAYFSCFKNFVGLEPTISNLSQYQASRICQNIIKDQLLTNTADIKQERINSDYSVENFYAKLHDMFGTDEVTALRQAMNSNETGRKLINTYLITTLDCGETLTSDELTILMICWIQDGVGVSSILSRLMKYKDRIDVNVSHYNTLLIETGNINLQECLEQMRELNIKPDRITLSILIETAGETKDIELLLKVTQIILHIIEVDIDVTMMEKIVRAYAQCGERTIPVLLLESMVKSSKNKSVEQINEPIITLDDKLAVDALLTSWEYRSGIKPLLNYPIKPTKQMVTDVVKTFKTPD